MHALGQQQLDDASMTAARGDVQGRIALGVAAVQINLNLQQQWDGRGYCGAHDARACCPACQNAWGKLATSLVLGTWATCGFGSTSSSVAGGSGIRRWHAQLIQTTGIHVRLHKWRLRGVCKAAS